MKRGDAGYSVVELALVMAILVGLTSLATPFFLSYYRASSVRVAAEEVAASVNQARQLGIKQNVSNPGVCVHIGSTALQYRLGSCTTSAVCSPTQAPPCIWVGPGTDSSGNVPLTLSQGVALTTNTDPVLNYLGAANPGATITVTKANTGETLRVCVAVSGRVSIRSSCS